jgi:UDP-glucose 4-epimerase
MDAFKSTKILVVGGAGFVGSNLVKMVLGSSPEKLVVIDNLLSAERENLPKSPLIEFIKGSITNDKVLRKLPDEFDYIFHLATYHGNQSSIHDPLADHENNTLTTLKLYETIKNFKHLKKVVYSSAGCTVAEKTYDTAHATTEEQPVSLYLDSPYQMSKIIGELYSNYYFKHLGVPITKARFQNVYGPGEVLGAGKWRGTPATVWRNVTPTFIYRAIKGLPLLIENGGIATRDFIYVEDIVRGLMLLAATGKPGDVYNLASGVETSIADLANLIVEMTGKLSKIELGPTRDWDHSGKRFGSTDKSRKELGFSTQMSLRDGLAATIAWTKENIDFIDACIHKHRKYVKVN